MQKKLYPILTFILTILFISNANYAKAQQATYNPVYGPRILQSSPLSIIKRLSYENFRNIKLLTSAISNFGGGRAELDKLIDTYADASAYFFQKDYHNSAQKFLENEKEIFEAAKKVVKTYRDDTDEMVTSGFKYKLKKMLRSSFSKKNNSTTSSDRLVKNAQFGLTKANDYHDRYKNANIKYANTQNGQKVIVSVPSPRGFIKAIYYYRRAKENMILMHKTFIEKPDKLKVKAKNNKEFDLKFKEMRKKYQQEIVNFDRKYKKVLDDNNNKISVREKQN